MFTPYTALLTSRPMLWLLFWVNLLGTIYGYEWYRQQLIRTVQDHSALFLPFVPDSPTASLFFTAALAFMLFGQPGRHTVWRGLIEALAVITSIKYGIWAVVMIAAGIYRGNPADWQDFMLSGSHLGMAAEALIFVFLFRVRTWHVAVAAIWMFSNDIVDYAFGVYPALPRVLDDILPAIEWFTYLLSALTVAVAWLAIRLRDTKKV